MIRLAQLVENREIIQNEANLKDYSGGKYSTPSSSFLKSNITASSNNNKGNTIFPMRTTTLRGNAAREVKKEGPLKRLSDVEFQARKEKGLCFRCNEKYSRDHKCKVKEQRELRMYIVKVDNKELKIVEDMN